MTTLPTDYSEKKIWFNKLLDPKKNCYNLRAFCKNVFGCTLEKNQYKPLRDMLDPKIRFIYYSCARQCVDGDTLVLLKNGKILPIKDIKKAWKTGKKEVYLIETKKGKQITCTLDHKFMTKQGWRTMHHIINRNWFFEVPDYLPYPKNINCTINKNRLKILGYLLSDGTGFLQYGQSIKFTNTNNLYLDEFDALIKKEFKNIKTKWYRKGNGYDILCTSGKKSYRTNELQAWINTLTFVGNFPIELMACNNVQAGHFLSRLYAGDGWATCKNRNREIGLGDDNLYFIKYLQLLLQKFGIHPLYRKETNCNMYKLRIQNKVSIDNFFKLCDIYGKEEACKKVKENIKNININNDRSSSIFRFQNYDKVKKVKKIGIKKTYDMEVLPEHYYYANGIKVHNSGKTHTIGIFLALTAIFPEFVVIHYKDKANAYIFAPKQEQAEKGFGEFSDKVHYNKYNIYMNALLEDKANKIKFKNGMEIRAITASRNAEIEGLTTHIIILDECCKSNSYIHLRKNGRYCIKSIKDIVNNKLQMEALTFNELTHAKEYKKILNYFKKQLKSHKLYKIRIKLKKGYKILECTGEHKIRTNKGMIKAKNLTKNHRILYK